jgi:hypothetical protein
MTVDNMNSDPPNDEDGAEEQTSETEPVQTPVDQTVGSAETTHTSSVSADETGTQQDAPASDEHDKESPDPQSSPTMADIEKLMEELIGDSASSRPNAGTSPPFVQITMGETVGPSTDEMGALFGLVKVGREWRGANPFGHDGGASQDGFVLFRGGHAWDRKLNQTYTRTEVYRLSRAIASGAHHISRSYDSSGGSHRNRPYRCDNFSWSAATTYRYFDENGKLLFEIGVVGSGSEKRIRQRRPDGCGGWINNLQGVRRVLFYLPEVITADYVFICEGEKAAERLNCDLRSCGQFGKAVATTSPNGAGSFGRVDPSPLYGKFVALLPDNDEPGARYCEAVLKALKGKARVKVLELPNLGPGGDYVDFRKAGYTFNDVITLLKATSFE